MLNRVDASRTFEDRTIVCATCGIEFTWTAGEQRFFDSRSLRPPKRCKACREQKRRHWEPEESAI
jgi:hypothetical protein